MRAHIQLSLYSKLKRNLACLYIILGNSPNTYYHVIEFWKQRRMVIVKLSWRNESIHKILYDSFIQIKLSYQTLYPFGPFLFYLNL